MRKTYRKFGNERYRYYNNHLAKDFAQAEAEEIRRLGGKARVIKSKGRKEWIVYSKKGRKYRVSPRGHSRRKKWTEPKYKIGTAVRLKNGRVVRIVNIDPLAKADERRYNVRTSTGWMWIKETDIQKKLY